MKIFACSDTHNNFYAFKVTSQCDLIVCAGDLTNYGSYFEFDLARSWLESCSEIAPTLWVPGNHDLGLQTESIPDSERLSNLLRDPKPVTVVTPNGDLTVAGASLAPCFSLPALAKRWAHMTADPDEDASYYAALPKVDILVSHAAPTGPTGIHTEYGDIGSPGLRAYIEREQPKVVICGHVHPCLENEETIGATKVYNVATISKIIEVS